MLYPLRISDLSELKIIFVLSNPPLLHRLVGSETVNIFNIPDYVE